MEKKTRYLINGKEYNSLDEVPAEFRALLEDKDQDGIPDIVQNAAKDGPSYVHNNVTYHSLEEMPPEVRAIVQKLQSENQSGSGIKTKFNVSVKVNRVVKTETKSVGPQLDSSQGSGEWENPQKYIEDLKRGMPSQDGAPKQSGFWARLFGKKR